MDPVTRREMEKKYESNSGKTTKAQVSFPGRELRDVGTHLLFLIPILALLNLITDLVTKFDFRFVFGLESVSVLTALTVILEEGYRYIPIGIIVTIVMMYYWLGRQARSGSAWPVVVGWVLYSTDMSLFYFSQHDKGFFVHVLISILLFTSFLVRVFWIEDPEE